MKYKCPHCAEEALPMPGNKEVLVCVGEPHCQFVAGKGEFEWLEDDELINLRKEVELLRQQVCDECSPDDYGWVHNRVEGKVPCACITESGAYQELQADFHEAIAVLRAIKPHVTTCEAVSVGKGSILSRFDKLMRRKPYD